MVLVERATLHGEEVAVPRKKSPAQLDREIEEVLAKKMPMKERLFMGTYPTGIAYADRGRERQGDYLRLAFLPFRSLKLEWSKVSIPAELRGMIERDAERLQKRRGELYQVSTAGQTVRLGD